MDGARLATASDLRRLRELAAQVRSEMEGARGADVLVLREGRARPLDDGVVDDPDRIVVAGTVDDTVMGYATGHIEVLEGGRRLGVIEDIFVEPGARAVGVGEAMMRMLLDWFDEQRAQGVDALALPGDRLTKNFFESNGFTARLLVMHRKGTA